MNYFYYGEEILILLIFNDFTYFILIKLFLNFIYNNIF